MKFSVRVEVDGLPGIADPEGQTIERALPVLGFGGVQSVHVGKVIRFDLDAATEQDASREVVEMCERLLANPVIERTEITITEQEASGSPK